MFFVRLITKTTYILFIKINIERIAKKGSYVLLLYYFHKMNSLLGNIIERHNHITKY